MREATGSGREPCRTCLASLTRPSLVLHRQRGTWGRACARAPSPAPSAYADSQPSAPPCHPPPPRALGVLTASPLPPPSEGPGGPNLQSRGLSPAPHAYADGQLSAPPMPPPTTEGPGGPDSQPSAPRHRGPWGSKPAVAGAVSPVQALSPALRQRLACRGDKQPPLAAWLGGQRRGGWSPA